MRVGSGGSKLDRACAGRGSSEIGVRCTTRFKNAHGTVFRELLYHWHPWFGMRVAIHEAVDKADGVVFRCTLSGSAADRWLEVPAWMFDRARCLDPSRLTASPFVSMDALSVLSDLLRQALKPPLSSSNAPHSGASRSSHDQNRGEAHEQAGFAERPLHLSPCADSSGQLCPYRGTWGIEKQERNRRKIL